MQLTVSLPLINNMEKLTTISNQEKPPETKIFFIRHSKATYASYAEKINSDNPEESLDLKNQLPDLPESGIELAEKSASEFLSKLDPEKDTIYVVSSNQMRALETAQIYAQKAQEMGFEVVENNIDGTNTSTKLVRTLGSLSLDQDNLVVNYVFQPEKITTTINWAKVKPETIEKYNKAREIVMVDDKGTWGANFHAHANKIKEIIPEIETPEELYNTQYKNLQRLADFARNKASGTKKVNILAFGHENYMSVALEEETGNHSIGNTEAVEILEDGHIKRVV